MEDLQAELQHRSPRETTMGRVDCLDGEPYRLVRMCRPSSWLWRSDLGGGSICCSQNGVARHLRRVACGLIVNNAVVQVRLLGESSDVRTKKENPSVFVLQLQTQDQFDH